MAKEKRLTDAQILAQLPAARERARAARAAEPRATHARYDRGRGLVIVELDNGAFFGFPADRAEGLRGASVEQLAGVKVSPSGEALHWGELDADLRVASLLQGVFGTRAWMRELARAGGRVRSEAKAQAARENGQRGGRPRRPAAAKAGERGAVAATRKPRAARPAAKPATAAESRRR